MINTAPIPNGKSAAEFSFSNNCLEIANGDAGLQTNPWAPALLSLVLLRSLPIPHTADKYNGYFLLKEKEDYTSA